MTDTETVHIVSTAPKQARAEVRGFTLVSDKPEAKGGQNQGPMPSEIFLASLGTCMSMTFRRIAEARRVPLDHLELVAEMDFSDKGDVTAVRLTARVRAKAAEKDIQKAFDMASQHCTVADLMRPGLLEKRLEMLS